MTEFDNIKKHWDSVGGEDYQYFWRSSLALKKLSEKEQQFIKKFIPSKTIKALDFGIGSGRLLNVLLENTNSQSEIYGLDISEAMVKYCQERFGRNKKIKEIKVIENLQDVDNYYKTKFNFITAIRVLKYNSNWRKILISLFEILQDNGIIIFTMPKKYLITRLSKPQSPFRATIGEIKKIAPKNQMEILEIKGFAKIPDFFYRIRNRLFSKIVLFSEDILRFMFGERIFEREVFYVLRK